MRKIIPLLLMLLLICSAVAMAETPAALSDAEWRAQQTAGQGYYVEGLTQEEFDALEETTIIKDPGSVTGYTVTFRYKDPDATRVRIRGEWSFSDAHGITVDGITYYEPEEWKIGNFAMIPDFQGDWPAYDMVKNEETGVWSYTIPLPSGTWSYRFYIGGVEGAELKDYTDAVQTTDPNNRPFEDFVGAQNNSQVRVPFDPDKQVEDYSLQLPNPDGKDGTGEIVYYNMPDDGTAYQLFVYLPYGYDAGREEPYNVLYISHGNGVESETSWYNKGSVAYMLDNLIAQGRVEPFVLVSINNYAVAETLGEYDVDNLINNIMPYVEANYNVSGQPEGRAVAGLSRGGRFTMETILTYPDEVGYYGLFSAGMPDNFDLATDLDVGALADSRIFVGYGEQELCDPERCAERLEMLSNLTGQGQFYDWKLFPGGHQWTVWRQNFVDFCEMTLWK